MSLPMRPLSAIDRILVHATATPNDIDVSIDDVRAWHVDAKPQGNGWPVIAYHFFLPRSGGVQRGCPLEVKGYHAGEMNYQSIGVCMAGAGVSLDDFTPEQLDTLAKLILELQADPSLPSDLLVEGHNQHSYKTCPGFDVPEWWSTKKRSLGC